MDTPSPVTPPMALCHSILSTSGCVGVLVSLYSSLNLIRNVPDARGRYMGQAGYGYVSFERSCDQNYGECWQLYYSPLEKVETLEPRLSLHD